MNSNAEYSEHLRAHSLYRRIRLVLSYVPFLAWLCAIAVAIGTPSAAMLLSLLSGAPQSWLATFVVAFAVPIGIVAAFVVYFVVQLAGEALTLLVDVADGLRLMNARAGITSEPGPGKEPIPEGER